MTGSRRVQVRELWLVPAGLVLLAIDYVRGRYF